MALQHMNQRRYALSRLKEAAYGVPYTAGADLVEFICKDRNFGNDAPVTADNKGYSTGKRGATEQWIVSHDLTVAKEFDACSEDSGTLLHSTFGGVSSSQPDAVGAPTVYKHVFSLQDLLTSRQLPPRTGLEQLLPAIDRRLVSLNVESLKFSGEGPTRLMGAVSFRGSGKKVSPSGVDFAADVVKALNRHYFHNSEVIFSLNDGATLTNFATAPNRLNSWGFEIANSYLADDGFRAGDPRFQTDGDADSGETRSELLLDEQVYNPTFNVRLLSGSDLVEAITTQKQFNGLWDIVGPQIVAVDTTDDTQGGDFNVTTDPVTVDKADYPGITPVVGDFYKIGNEILRVSVVDVATFTLQRARLGTLNVVHADAVSIFKLYHHRMIIEAFKMPFKTRNFVDRNGLVGLDIVPNVLYDAVNDRDVQVTLYNTVASYTS